MNEFTRVMSAYVYACSSVRSSTRIVLVRVHDTYATSTHTNLAHRPLSRATISYVPVSGIARLRRILRRELSRVQILCWGTMRNLHDFAANSLCSGIKLSPCFVCSVVLSGWRRRRQHSRWPTDATKHSLRGSVVIVGGASPRVGKINTNPH